MSACSVSRCRWSSRVRASSRAKSNFRRLGGTQALDSFMRPLGVVWFALGAVLVLPTGSLAQQEEVTGLQIVADNNAAAAAATANAPLSDRSFAGPGGSQVTIALPEGFSVS